MNTDCTYHIGHDHTVCEDYAVAHANNQAEFACAIVCDGCSASPDVDFGARVLAKAVEDVALFHGKDTDIDAQLLGTMSIQKAARIFEILPTLHPQALDATCLLVMVHQKQARVMMFGDGVFVHRMKNGTNAVHIHLTSGAPDYLSYSLDKKRRAAYDLMAGNKKEIDIKLGTQCLGFKTDCKPFEPYTITVPVEEGDVLSVVSDGINSFRRSDNSAIDWGDLVNEFTAYKNFNGQFVQRRINAFKRHCIKEGWQHLDDISVASIVI